MTPRFDFAASVLLCSEDSTTIFDLEEEEREGILCVLRPSPRHANAPSGALSIDFPLQSESCIEAFLGREEYHLPMEGYAERLLLQQPGGSDLGAIRNYAIDWIWKVSFSPDSFTDLCVQDELCCAAVENIGKKCHLSRFLWSSCS